MSDIKQKPFEERKADSERIRAKYPNHVPTKIFKAEAKDPEISKRDFLLDKNKQACHIFATIRNKYIGELKPEEGLHFMVGNNMISGATLMSQVDKDYVDEDGFLYLSYSVEHTYGC